MSSEFELDEALVTGPRGTVFGPISHTAGERGDERRGTGGGVTVVLGQQGSGRTSLLLCLAGRMRLTSGSLRVLGESSLREIRALTGIAGFSEIDALEPSVTVGATLRERVAWALPWYRRAPKVTEEIAHELLAPAFGEPARTARAVPGQADPASSVAAMTSRAGSSQTATARIATARIATAPTGVAQPAPETLIRDLDPAQEMLLRIALALIDDPQLLLLDDFDDLKHPADRRRVARRLSALARSGIGVVLATSDPRDVELFEPGEADLLEL